MFSFAHINIQFLTTDYYPGCEILTYEYHCIVNEVFQVLFWSIDDICFFLKKESLFPSLLKEETTFGIFIEFVSEGSLVYVFEKRQLDESTTSAYTRHILRGGLSASS